MPLLRYEPGDDLCRLFPDLHWAPKPGDEIEITDDQAATINSPFLRVIPDAVEAAAPAVKAAKTTEDNV